MKKKIYKLLILMFCLSLCGCNNKNKEKIPDTQKEVIDNPPVIKELTMEETILKKLDEYLKNNNIKINDKEFYSFKEIGYKLNSNCYEDGLILIDNYEKKLLYVCDNKNSPDLDNILNKNSLSLAGPNPYYLKIGSTYNDPGYYDNVKADITIGDMSSAGMYLVNYKELNSISRRVVIVTSKDFDNYPDIKLNGQINKNINLEEEYVEEGYSAYDNIDGNITGKVVVENKVNKNNPGIYSILYKVTNTNGMSIEVVRKITVLNTYSELLINYSLNPSTITNNDVTINLSMIGVNYTGIIDPSGNHINKSNYEYIVKENGRYVFYIKKKDGTIEKKAIIVSNIDKEGPNGTCKSVITEGKTTVTVSSENITDIAKIDYIIDGKLASSTEEKNYIISKESNTTEIILHDIAGNSTNVKCNVINNVKELDKTYKTDNYNKMNYILYIPSGLKANSKIPLVVYLHGSGGCGTSITNLTEGTSAFIKGLKSEKYKGAIFIAPQCDCKDDKWNNNCLDNVKEIIDSLISKYNIDTSRISVTGHSLGGIGTYAFIARYQNFFSSALVVSGLSRVDESKLTNIKIKAYHGTNDTSVPYSGGRSTINKIKEYGGNAELISLNGEGHSIASYVYNETDAIEWLINNRKNN